MESLWTSCWYSGQLKTDRKTGKERGDNTAKETSVDHRLVSEPGCDRKG